MYVNFVHKLKERSGIDKVMTAYILEKVPLVAMKNTACTTACVLYDTSTTIPILERSRSGTHCTAGWLGDLDKNKSIRFGRKARHGHHII